MELSEWGRLTCELAAEREMATGRRESSVVRWGSHPQRRGSQQALASAVTAVFATSTSCRAGEGEVCSEVPASCFSPDSVQCGWGSQGTKCLIVFHFN